MINSALEREVKSTDELLCMLIEEWDGRKHNSLGVNPSSSSSVVNFTQTNPHTSGTSAGATTTTNPSAQLVNHFHSQTTIEDSTPTFGMPQQTMASMFGQVYMQIALSFSMLNYTSAPYTPEGNDRAYVHSSRNFQAPNTIVAYTDPIPLPGSTLGFLPNHTYQNASQFNAYD
jgi:hypothetical protein